MKLKKFLKAKVKGNPYYEGLTVSTLVAVMIPFMFKLLFDMILYVTIIVEPPLTIELIIVELAADSLLFILLNSAYIRQFKTDLWDGLSITIEILVMLYNVLYTVLLVLLPFALSAVVGFKVMIGMVLTMTVIVVVLVLKKGKLYDEKKNGLADYKSEINQNNN